jgi:hypothetical protein
MHAPQTAKPAHRVNGGELLKSEQLSRQLSSQNSEPQPPKQGPTIKILIQTILILHRLTELLAGLPR